MQDSVRPLFRLPQLLGAIDDLLAVETTRHAGNLGLYTGDRPQRVDHHRRRLWLALGLSEGAVAGAHQVHGDRVLHATSAGQSEGYDALITDRTGLFLSITVADCTPILICDPERRAVAAIHAGWRGTVARIVAKTLAEMSATFGTDPRDCLASVGTCIDECEFEVGSEVAEQFDPAFVRWDELRAKHFVDLKAANQTQLLDAGLPAPQIEVSPYCTVQHNTDYFSYRAEQGRTGRMLALIGWRKNRKA